MILFIKYLHTCHRLYYTHIHRLIYTLFTYRYRTTLTHTVANRYEARTAVAHEEVIIIRKNLRINNISTTKSPFERLNIKPSRLFIPIEYPDILDLLKYSRHRAYILRTVISHKLSYCLRVKKWIQDRITF